ncbi:STAS domain-containing protein [Prauserella oleivorans]|uniref:Anti-sigma factor antagonist n=1 Tax=Prauserella oleivorans TaxID=1478153 RepID=A0ABW5W9B6_9PSEU
MGVETLHLHDTQVGTVTVERVTGEVDSHNIDELDHRLGIDCSHAGGPVVVDLTHVTFFGAAGLNLLVRLHEQCESRGCSLHVVAPSRAVCRPIEAAELDMRLNIVRTIDEALATEGQGW